MAKAILTQAYVKELLNYHSGTGIFTRLPRRGKGNSLAREGKPTGSRDTRGYVHVAVDGVAYYAHRLAWLYVTGSWPKVVIDHKDGNRSNNAFSNLRAGSHSDNAHNTRTPRKSNTSGYLGVTWDKSRGKWQAAICVKRKSIALGRFDTPEEAHAAYVAAKRKLHPFGNL